MRIAEGLLPETLNDLPFNPLEIEANPLGIRATRATRETPETDGLVQLTEKLMDAAKQVHRERKARKATNLKGGQP